MKKIRSLKGMLMGAAMVAMTSTPALAEIDEATPGAIKGVDLIESWVKAGAPNGAFTYTDISGNFTNATFDVDILPLFTKANIWADDTGACSSCHTGNTEESLHEMDLTSYKGLMLGGDVLAKPPGVPLFGQSKVGATDYDWAHSKMKGRLRNNRMPPGTDIFDITEENRDGPCVEMSVHGAKIKADEYGCETNAVGLMQAWIEAGGSETASFSYGTGKATFKNDILPLYTKENVWFPDTPACSSCHTGNTEESLHEMDLTSYKGIMLGGDVLAKPPGVPLFGQSAVGKSDYSWGHGKMKGRLRNNRMPPGITFDITEENRNGPVVLHGKR